MQAKELADLADEYWHRRQERLALEHKARQLKLDEDVMHYTLINYLKDNKLTSIGGLKIQLELKEVFEPVVVEWSMFYGHIQNTGEFELLYRRLNAKAVKDRWDDGVQVPGVGKFPVPKLSKHEVT